MPAKRRLMVSYGRLADAGTVKVGCALDDTGHRVARIGAALCRALRSPALSVDPVGVPARRGLRIRRSWQHY